jgi:hypothetical protein
LPWSIIGMLAMLSGLTLTNGHDHVVQDAERRNHVFLGMCSKTEKKKFSSVSSNSTVYRFMVSIPSPLPSSFSSFDYD